MKVAELKNVLGLRNLSKNGRKQELLDRLIVAVRSNAPLIENKIPEHAANMAGLGLAGSNRGNLGPVPAPVGRGCRGPPNTLIIAL